MPKGRYTIGGKGTHGCKGYPVVGDTGKVHGCHTTREAAQRQQAAIYASENAKKSIDEWSFLLNKNCECNECFTKAKTNDEGNESSGKRKKEKHGPMHKSMSIVTDHPECQGFGLVNENGELISCHKTRADAENAAAQHESQDTESQSGPNHDMNNVNKSMNTDPNPITGEEREAVLDTSESPLTWAGVFSPVITKAAKPNYGNIIKPRKGSPANKELYARIVAEAKRKFDVYPSAVANAWVVAEYKRRGGKYNSK